MKKKTILILLIVSIAIIFAIAFRYSKKATTTTETKSTEPSSVTVQSAKNSISLIQNIEYPAITAGDQEITLTAQTSGTITEMNFDLGKRVAQNTQLAKIDSTGTFSSAGDENLQNSSVEVLGLTIDSAEESYKAAKDAYKNNKTYANKKAEEIAKINLKAARINLKGVLDSHYIVSPISGTVTQRFVSQGDSVSPGQTLAKISKTGLTKVQFFVNKEDFENFKTGMKITINEDGQEIAGIVSRISPQADPTTRRFLIEAKPAEKTSLVIGNVITVSFEINKTPSTQGNLILPLSVITVGQNEKYIFILENGKAKKVTVEVVNVLGEAAEIKTSISPDAQIIMNGSKLVQDGDIVKTSNQ